METINVTPHAIGMLAGTNVTSDATHMKHINTDRISNMEHVTHWKVNG